jgi:glycosyltransferase involved in cell wall biosynthesis
MESPEGVKVVHFRGNTWNPLHAPDDMRARLLRNEDKIDVLVINGQFNPPTAGVAKAATEAAIPYVVCPRGAYHPALLRKRRLRKFVYGRIFERPLLRRASAVHVLAEEHKGFLFDFAGPVPAFAVPNGFNPEEVPEIDREGTPSGGGDRATPNLLYLGRLDTYVKGLDLLLEALSIGMHDGKLPSSLRLDLVGADRRGDRRKLELLADRLRISRNLRFLGRTPAPNRWNAILSYDLLVLPSRHDAFATAVLEAMVLAKPVIVSEQAGVSFFVRDAQCGYLVQPNPASICAGLVRAIETRDQWRSMGDRGRAFAYEHLTWEKVAERVVHSLEQVLGRARATA